MTFSPLDRRGLAAAIFAYAIRLGIVSRRAAENTEKGSDRLRNMMKAQAPSAE